MDSKNLKRSDFLGKEACMRRDVFLVHLALACTLILWGPAKADAGPPSLNGWNIVSAEATRVD